MFIWMTTGIKRNVNVLFNSVSTQDLIMKMMSAYQYIALIVFALAFLADAWKPSDGPALDSSSFDCNVECTNKSDCDSEICQLLCSVHCQQFSG